MINHAHYASNTELDTIFAYFYIYKMSGASHAVAGLTESSNFGPNIVFVLRNLLNYTQIANLELNNLKK